MGWSPLPGRGDAPVPEGPGRGGRVGVALTGGERLGGADSHLFVVQDLVPSGRDRDFDNRQIAIERIPFLAVGGGPVVETDADVVVLGEFNTMGRSEPPAVPAEQEIELFDEALRPGYRRLVPEPACSEYLRGEGGLLDHVVVGTGMQEAAVGSRVSGYCGIRECVDLMGGEPAGYDVLSDHCSVLLEAWDVELDGD